MNKSNTGFQNGERYDSTREAWEDIWSGASIEVELEAVQYDRAQATLNAYLPFLSPNDLHLEAGSGLSAVIIEMRKRGYEVVGLDYAVKALQVSRTYDPSLHLTGGDVHTLPFAENTFGSYLSFGVLEHFEHGMIPALHEAYRIIQPGGVVVLTIPYPNLVYKLVQWQRDRAGESGLTDDDFYESTYTHHELQQNLEAVGFEVVLVQPTSHDFTFWGLGGLFQADGYYKTSGLAKSLGSITEKIMPWQFNFMTLIVGRK